jgi:soluble lytic murein transglycosylase-like protein
MFFRTSYFSYIYIAIMLSIFSICGLHTNYVHAGAQKEEELTHTVKSALSKVISDDASIDLNHLFQNAQHKLEYEIWKNKVSARLLKKIPNDILRSDLIDYIYYESKRSGLEPEMVLGLIQIESGFKKYAISPVGARGLMQVMPFWTRSIGNGDTSALFNVQVNLRYGCAILKHYIDREKGNLYLALGRYNGSRGQPQYPNAVRAGWDSWKKTINQ